MQYITYKTSSDAISSGDIIKGDIITLKSGMRGKVCGQHPDGLAMKAGKHKELVSFISSDVAKIERRQVRRVRIHQIIPLNSEFVFRSYSEVRAKGQTAPPAELYRVVFDGQLETDDLEKLFSIFNLSHPAGYNGRSLSVSDIVELYDESGSRFFYCDTFGFKRIRFKPVCDNDPAPSETDIGFPCCLHDTDRTLDWCENNCSRYYSCDTVAMAIDELGIREGQ